MLDGKINYVIIKHLQSGVYHEKRYNKDQYFKAQAKAWLQAQDAYEKRQGHIKPQAPKRPQKTICLMGYLFPSKERLKNSDAIKAVLDQARPFRGKLVNIYLVKRPAGSCNRAAFLVRKALYNKKLVLRNRFKRVLREAYRHTRHLLPEGYDIAIMAMCLKKDTKSTNVQKELKDVFKKISKK